MFWLMAGWYLSLLWDFVVALEETLCRDPCEIWGAACFALVSVVMFWVHWRKNDYNDCKCVLFGCVRKFYLADCHSKFNFYKLAISAIFQILVLFRTNTINSTPTPTLWSLLCCYVMLAWSCAGHFLREYDHNNPELCGKLNFQVSLLE